MSRLEAGKYYILDQEENFVSAKPDKDRESLTPDVDGPDPDAYALDNIVKEWTIIQSTGQRYFIQNKMFTGHDIHQSYAVWTWIEKSSDVTTAWRSTLYDWGWALWKIKPEDEDGSYRIAPANKGEEGRYWGVTEPRSPIELTSRDTSTLWKFQRIGPVPSGADPIAKEYATCQWLVNRGVDLRKERRYNDALNTQTEVLGRLRQLSKTHSSPAITELLAVSLQNRGYDLIATKHHDDAVRMHEESVGLFKNLEMPDVILHARALQILAASLRALGNHEGARRVRDEGDRMFRKLAKADPGQVAVTMRGLAADLRSIDLVEDAVRAEIGARRLFSKVVATFKFLRKPLPVEPRLVQPKPQALPPLVVLSSLLDCLKQLAEDKRALGRKPEAEEIDSDVVTLGWACSFVTQH
ncbi:hypothetical protein K438DRAFT_1990500 [Mycena galopus ATCC 62051]|nr:hypothetical protein K438DRAFT_1990500 [Mycena galopus ATCC 62051]